MVSSQTVPWYNRPARPFPVHIWQAQRFGFRIPPLRFAQQAAPPAGVPRRRPFPAKVWVAGRQAGW